MTAGAHDAVTLGCYALGVLDAHEKHGVEQHLRGCPSCRAQVADFHRIRLVLDEVPREVFLPESELPTPSDLVLQRALRQIRNEARIPEPRSSELRSGQRSSEQRQRASPVPADDLPEPQHVRPRRWPGYLTAAAVAAVVAFGAGAVFSQNETAQTTTASPRQASGTDSRTGIRLVAEIAPSSQDRYQVKARINGLPAAQKCKLVVVGMDGKKSEAFVWTSTEKGRVNGADVTGMVNVPPDQVKSIAVENAEGKTFVTADL